MILHPNVKVNLGLDVLRKRPDGYHDLNTLFVPYFGISDTLEIISGDDFSRTSAELFSRYDSSSIRQSVSEDGKLMITIAKEGGVDWSPLTDLCAKAYFLLDAEFSLPAVKIFLEKTSPVGAGLGGGSSDAAFTLRSLNEVFSLGLSEDSLAERASRLGSDCPFFIFNRPMFGRGRGEQLEDFPLEDIDYGQPNSASCKYILKVVCPEGISVSTAEAYRGIVPSVPSISLDIVLKEEILSWKDNVKNDFEKTVFVQHPQLSAIKDSLYDSGAVYASMSGSGSALFAIYEKQY